jgi:hypothetical protein
MKVQILEPGVEDQRRARLGAAVLDERTRAGGVSSRRGWALVAMDVVSNCLADAARAPIDEPAQVLRREKINPIARPAHTRNSGSKYNR